MISKPPPGICERFGPRVAACRCTSRLTKHGDHHSHALLSQLLSPENDDGRPSSSSSFSSSSNDVLSKDDAEPRSRFPLVDPSTAHVLDLCVIVVEQEEAKTETNDVEALSQEEGSHDSEEEEDNDDFEQRAMIHVQEPGGSCVNEGKPATHCTAGRRCSAAASRSSRTSDDRSYGPSSSSSWHPTVSAGMGGAVVLKPRELVPIAIECDRALEQQRYSKMRRTEGCDDESVGDEDGNDRTVVDDDKVGGTVGSNRVEPDVTSSARWLASRITDPRLDEPEILLWTLGRRCCSTDCTACHNDPAATPETTVALLVAMIELEHAIHKATVVGVTREGRGDQTSQSSTYSATTTADDRVHSSSSTIAAKNAPLLTVLLKAFERLEVEEPYNGGARVHKEEEASVAGEISERFAAETENKTPPAAKSSGAASELLVTAGNRSGQHVAVASPPREVDFVLSPFLNCLLLPSSGLNLRNLLWHGFVGTLKRPWLSLLVVLLSHLKKRRTEQHHPPKTPAMLGRPTEMNKDSDPEPVAGDNGTRPTWHRMTNRTSSIRAPSAVRTVITSLPKKWKAALRASTGGEGSLSKDNPNLLWSLDPIVVKAVSSWMPTPQHVELWHLAADWISIPVNRRGRHRSRPLRHVRSPTTTSIGAGNESETSSPSSPESTNPTRHVASKPGVLYLELTEDESVEMHSTGDIKPSDFLSSFRPSSLVCAILVVLLEAGLRNQFCEANNVPLGSDAAVARPGAYYVTLDGHGQRLQHQLLLQPYLTAKETRRVPAANDYPVPDTSSSVADEVKVKNRLMEQLGASLASILTDLFVSPYGPNLRAAISHGRWIDRMRFDLAMLVQLMDQTNDSEKDRLATCGQEPNIRCESLHNPAAPSDDEVNDTMELLLAVLYACAISNKNLETNGSSFTACYQPQFSFTATCLAALQGIQSAWDSLICLVTSPNYLTTSDSHACFAACDSIKEFTDFLQGGKHLQFNSLDVQERLHGMMLYLRRPKVGPGALAQWTLDHLFHEFDTNRKLGPMVATRSLLNDLNAATSRLFGLLQTSLLELNSFTDSGASSLTGRQRKGRARYIRSADAVISFYSVACHVALESLQTKLRSSRHGTEMWREPLSRDRSSCLSSEELLKVVQRTRMVVSTVDTFFIVNSDRALKAIDGYTKNKLVRKFISFYYE